MQHFADSGARDKRQREEREEREEPQLSLAEPCLADHVQLGCPSLSATVHTVHSFCRHFSLQACSSDTPRQEVHVTHDDDGKPVQRPQDPVLPMMPSRSGQTAEHGTRNENRQPGRQMRRCRAVTLRSRPR